VVDLFVSLLKPWIEGAFREASMRYLFALAALAVAGLVQATPAAADNTGYAYCVINDNSRDTAYYSAIFSADPGNSMGYENAFDDYVVATYGQTDFSAHCFVEDDRSSAQSGKAADEAQSRGIYGHIVETGWSG
jgi:hypothetical protein